MYSDLNLFTVFKLLDVREKGELSLTDMCHALRKMGIELTESEMTLMLLKYVRGFKAGNTIDFATFKSIFRDDSEQNNSSVVAECGDYNSRIGRESPISASTNKLLKLAAV